MTEPLTSLYLHIPFCSVRCGYCDFITCTGMNHKIPEYVNALQEELAFIGKQAGRPIGVHSVYFGGGTPSLLPTSDITAILQRIATVFDLKDEAEITLEANPNNLDIKYLSGLRRAGVNRLSIGVQSMNIVDLRTLDRKHDPAQVIKAIAESREAGFDNISLDLIFGIPGQDLNRWENTLQQAVGLNPQHLSLYSLTVEEGTPLFRLYNKGCLPLIDEDQAADMYELAMDFLGENDYRQYEISNWSKTDRQGKLLASLHNMQYWKNLPYIGIGTGAHGSWMGCRLVNPGDIERYIQLVQSNKQAVLPATPATCEINPINPYQEMQETMMVGLRLTREGVSRPAFFARFGKEMEDVFGEEIKRLRNLGLLEVAEINGQGCLRLSRRGRLLGNMVFREFV